MEKLKAFIDQFPKSNILVVGDVMLDKYVIGNVERISPEAPIPVLNVKSEVYAPGGAANVAANVASLGGNVALFGFIGDDGAGRILTEQLRDKGIKFYPSFSGRTVQKVRPVAGGHQFLRLDYEDLSPKRLENPKLDEEAEKADIIVVSNYLKGAISEELMTKLKGYRKKIILDTKPQNCDFYKGIYLIKLNESEALKIAAVGDVQEAGKKIGEMLGSKVIVTRGPKGMMIFDKDIKEIPSVAREVFDVTGAGDTALAALALSIAVGASLEEAAIISNYAAGLAVEKVGTTAVRLAELEIRVFKKENKIKTKEELKTIIQEYRAAGKKVVWTNGCFDLLHEGHVRYLKKAAEIGDILVVGLNSDRSVRELKGPTRPLRPQEARAEILAGLECVDNVIIFDETNISNIFDYIKPNIFVKASDYSLEKMNQEERRVIEANGAKITFVQIEDNISTSNIIGKIKEMNGKE